MTPLHVDATHSTIAWLPVQILLVVTNVPVIPGLSSMLLYPTHVPTLTNVSAEPIIVFRAKNVPIRLAAFSAIVIQNIHKGFVTNVSLIVTIVTRTPTVPIPTTHGHVHASLDGVTGIGCRRYIIETALIYIN